MDELIGLLVRIDGVLLPLVVQLVPGHSRVILEEALGLLFSHRRDMREVVTLASMLVSAVDCYLSSPHPHNTIDEVVFARSRENVRLHAFRDLDS